MEAYVAEQTLATSVTYGQADPERRHDAANVGVLSFDVVPA